MTSYGVFKILRTNGRGYTTIPSNNILIVLASFKTRRYV